MKNRFFSTQLIGLALLTVAAGPSVAMRVDVHVLPNTATETTLAISVQIAPEDRGRIGKQARMRIKLFQGEDEILHRLLDVDVDDNGGARAEFDAPPGSYGLEVGLGAVRGDAQGFWRGTVAVPAVGDAETAVAATAQTEMSPHLSVSESTDEDEKIEESDANRSERLTPVPVAPAVVATKPVQVAKPEPVTSTMTRSGGAQSPGQPAATEPATELSHPATSASQEDPAQAEQLPRATAPTPTPAPALLHEIPVEFLIAFDVADENLSRAASIYQHFQTVAERHGLSAIKIELRTRTTTSALNDLAAALATVAQPPGLTTLVLVTDGLRRQPRAEWKAADATILQAGVPLLAVGLWNKSFDAASRKNLGRIAVYSGGRFYLLQPGDSAASVVSFFGLDNP